MSYNLRYSPAFFQDWHTPAVAPLAVAQSLELVEELRVRLRQQNAEMSSAGCQLKCGF